MQLNEPLLWIQPAPDASGGAGTQPPAPAAYAGLSQAAVLADFARRLANLEGAVRYSVPGDRVISQILLTSDTALISADKIALVGEVTFADWQRDLSGIATGAIDPLITQIRGGVIRTGKVMSFDAASYLNLDTTGTDFLKCASTVLINKDGTFSFGSGASLLTLSGGVLNFAGNMVGGGYIQASGAASVTGTIFATNLSGSIYGASNTAATSVFDCAVVGYNGSTSATGAGHVGVAGICVDTTHNTAMGVFGYSGAGTGVYGLTDQSGGVGVVGKASHASGYGVTAVNAGGGVALSALGHVEGSTYVAATDSAATMATGRGGTSVHASHNLADGDYYGGAKPTAGTAPFLYFHLGGKVVAAIDSHGLYGYSGTPW